MIRHSISLLVFFLLSLQLYSQQRELSSTNKKAVTHYTSAIEAYDKYDYYKAELFLTEAIKLDKKFIEAHLMLAQVYQETGKIDEAIASAENALAIDPEFFPLIYYNLGNLHLFKGDYNKALTRYQKFIGYMDMKEETREMALFRMECCSFALNALDNPVPFEPINLGKNVNSDKEEYWPSLSADENTLVLTVSLPKDSTSDEVFRNRQEDFFITFRDENGNWLPKRNLGRPINTPINNEGAQSLSADGNRMYYTFCAGVCNLFVSDRQADGTWGRPQKLPEPVNLPGTSEKQPSISPDGRTLFFVSNRTGGKGRFDIWYSTRLDDNRWSNPVNLGDSINTPFNEQSPFIHFDNQTLYFASDGHIGMGGLDLYVSRKINDSLWSKPFNLGYPINTHKTEDGLIVNAKGTVAYYSSNRDPEAGRDIYSFNINPEIKPNPVSYVTGKITDIKSGWPIKARFQLVDIETGEEIMDSESTVDGNYLVCLPTDKSYAFYASAPSYLFHSDHFDLKGVFSALEPFRKNIKLKPIKVGEVMVMRNIFFNTDSYELKNESIVELSRIVDFLKNNSTLQIEVGGHTDDVGADDYNLKLSENRAKAVVNYLTSKNISPERLSWKGYGETKPIVENTTSEGRAQNRRTEIRVIGM